jgi:hypothetical protein
MARNVTKEQVRVIEEPRLDSRPLAQESVFNYLTLDSRIGTKLSGEPIFPIRD